MSITDRKHCTGCGACVDACPAHCISMETSEDGFFFPVIQESLCLECGVCGKVCHVENPPEKKMPRKAFASWSLDESIRMSSSSGGLYSILGEYVIQNGGVISGCRFDRNMVLKHELCDIPGCTARFRGSKYVQSLTDGIYRKIRDALKTNRTVLFVATPCQVAGLLSFLGQPYENLIVCDLVCHGIPSQKIFRSYLTRHGLSPDPDRAVVAFRDLKGWGDYYIRVSEPDGTEWKADDKTNEYIRAFLSGYNSNEACYSCPYACMERVGDLTLADFWGLGKEMPFSSDAAHGCSLILVNTQKGADLLESVRGKLFLEERTIDEARKGNGQLRNPVQRPPMRDEFYHMDWGTIAPMINYGNASPLRRVLRFCKRSVLNMLKRDGR